MPPERLRALPGYDPDVQKNRGEAREITQRLGYGPDNPLAVKWRPATFRSTEIRQSC